MWPSYSGERRSLDLVLAEVVAYLANPFIFPPLLFGLVFVAMDVSVRDGALSMGVVILGGVLLPLFVVLREVRLGRITSFQMSRAVERRKPYLAASIGFAGVAAVLLLMPQTRHILMLIAACYAVNTLLIVVIANRWKPSVHTASITCFLSILLYIERNIQVAVILSPEPRAISLEEILANSAALLDVSPVAIIVLLLLTALVGWARVRTGTHSVAEVGAGSLFGLLLPYVELSVILWTGRL